MKRYIMYIFVTVLFIAAGRNAFADTLEYYKTYGNFQNAVSISVGRSEFIFVSDAQQNQILRYSKLGIEDARFGGTGFGSNGLNNPVSIDASNGLDLYVCDNLNNRITKLDYKLNFITAFDFNVYNQTADNSKRIINPVGVTSFSSGDIAVIIRSSEYKSAIINSFSDISIFMGSNFGYDRIGSPAKIVKGRGLDLWILDSETSEVLNFTSTGTFVKRLKPPVGSKIISITFFSDFLYMLTDKNIIKYDLKNEKYDSIYDYTIDSTDKINDFALFDNSTYLLLSSKRIYQYNLTK